MQEYRIKIDYMTGNSFGSENTSDYLELTFKDLNVAKENLKRIKEHYEMYQDIEGWRSTKTRDQWYEENINKDWFVNKPKLWNIKLNEVIDERKKELHSQEDLQYKPDDYYATHCLYLYIDEGVQIQMSAFWCGYFETLNSAEIEADSSDMKITF